MPAMSGAGLPTRAVGIADGRGCHRRLWQALAIGLWAAAVPAAASSDRPIRGTEIAQAIVAALAAEGLAGDPQIGPARLFPPCPTALQVDRGGSAGWATARVDCPGGGTGWPLMVRTKAGAAASETQSRPARVPDRSEDPDAARPWGKVVVLSASLRAGEVIGPQHVRMGPSSQSPGTGLFSDPAAVIGRRMLVALGEGQPLRTRHVDIAWAIPAGAPVLIVNQVGGIEIITAGVAEENAQPGDRLAVRNAASGQVVQTIALSQEKVRPLANIPTR